MLAHLDQRSIAGIVQTALDGEVNAKQVVNSPFDVADEVHIWTTDLLPDESDVETYYCCNYSAWWYKSNGQMVCGKYHPNPLDNSSKPDIIAPSRLAQPDMTH